MAGAPAPVYVASTEMTDLDFPTELTDYWHLSDEVAEEIVARVERMLAQERAERIKLIRDEIKRWPSRQGHARQALKNVLLALEAMK